MKSKQFIDLAERDAKIVEALHLARYALVIHDRLTVRCEGEEWEMNFAREIDKLTDVMEMLGIDTSCLTAPMRPNDADGDS